MAPFVPSVLDWFGLLWPEDVYKLFGEAQLTTPLLTLAHLGVLELAKGD